MPELFNNGYAQRADKRNTRRTHCDDALLERAGTKAVDARATPASKASEEQLANARLARTIEAEVIPRLMLAHRTPGIACTAPNLQNPALDADQVREFASLLRTCDVATGLQYLCSMRERGFQMETLYLSLIAPAARYLGELWDEDLCDFAEVTVALGRIQQLVRQLSPDFLGRSEIGAKGLKILLAPAHGEQHSLGLMMVKEFFLREGWNVWAETFATSTDLSRIVQSEWFDVAGFSVSCDCRLEKLASCICSIRLESRNQGIAVLVGGPIFASHPEYVTLLGADAVAMDAEDALVRARHLVAQRPASIIDRSLRTK